MTAVPYTTAHSISQNSHVCNPSLFPKKPYCSKDLSSGVVIRTRALALTFSYIQVNDLMLKAVILDLDYPGAARAWLDQLTPPPTWIAESENTGHAHCAWVLTSPIPRTDAARLTPLRYFAAVEHSLGLAYKADPGYAGLLTKNPMRDDVWRVSWPGKPSYTLTELTAGLDLESKPESSSPALVEKVTGTGRNVTLFDTVRHWAYAEIPHYWRPGGHPAWLDAVRAKTDACNVFPTPLPASEIKAIAKSIANWTWKHITPAGREKLIKATHSSEKQRERVQKRWGDNTEKKEKVKELKLTGLSSSEIAKMLGVPARTVRSWGPAIPISDNSRPGAGSGASGA